jgi:hypothetical protein
MISAAEPKLVAGFRDSPRDVYRLVDEEGAEASSVPRGH